MSGQSILTWTIFIAETTLKTVGLNMFSKNVFGEISGAFGGVSAVQAAVKHSSHLIQLLLHFGLNNSWNIEML